MPTYEYQCDVCKHRFDLSQSITASAIRKCPACGRLKVRRLISGGGGIIFKGSGFYITDHRSESYKQAASRDSSETSGSPAAPAAPAASAASAPDGAGEGKAASPAPPTPPAAPDGRGKPKRTGGSSTKAAQ